MLSGSGPVPSINTRGTCFLENILILEKYMISCQLIITMIFFWYFHWTEPLHG